MRRTLAAALLLTATAGAASAGTLTVTVPDAVLTRMVAAVEARAAQHARPAKPGENAAAPMTDAQAQRAILEMGLQRTRQETIAYERSLKIQAAIKTVPDLPAIPAQ